MAISVSSLAFQEGALIPAKYTCQGQDTSPALEWSAPPQGTQSVALIVDDPDAPAGTWVHWVLFNLPAETRSLAENFQPVTPIIVGKNSWGKNTYGGPCPPSGTEVSSTDTSSYRLRIAGLGLASSRAGAASPGSSWAEVAARLVTEGSSIVDRDSMHEMPPQR